MVHGWHWHFRVYQDQLEAMPAILYGLPVYISETDQDDAWADVNSGWVQAAYAEIDRWNQSSVPTIHALCLFRSQQGDKWSFADKNGVKADFRAAVARGYTIPDITPPSPPPDPKPPGPEPQPPAPAPGPERTIDPRLLARGVHFDFAHPPAGTWYWRMTDAHWLDEKEADSVGPDHHILGNTMRGPNFEVNVPLLVSWPSGSTVIRSKPPQPGIIYTYDYPMSSSLNEFSIWVNDGNESDKVYGIGMGKLGNPSIHTSTWLTFEWVQVAETITPEPPPVFVDDGLIWPVRGIVTQPFGDPPALYGQIGHNGIDIACAIGTSVLAITQGEVMITGWDDTGYGNYCRIFYPSINSHGFVAHLEEIRVRIGDIVHQGETVAISGNSGNSSGPHLHYELRGGTRERYFEGLCYGYTKGRYDPVVAYLVTGSPLSPAAD
jgi:hypothetical protein